MWGTATRFVHSLHCYRTYPADLPTTGHPLPLGMPIYELILGRTQAFAILSQSADDYLPYQYYVDFTNTCVIGDCCRIPCLKLLVYVMSWNRQCFSASSIWYWNTKGSTGCVKSCLSTGVIMDSAMLLPTLCSTILLSSGSMANVFEPTFCVLLFSLLMMKQQRSKRTGTFALSMLELCRILSVDGIATSSDISLCDNILLNCWLILFGDGLSHLWLETFKECTDRTNQATTKSTGLKLVCLIHPFK